MARDSFETVAITYSQPETAVMLSMFAWYGIPAYALGNEHARVAAPMVVALQGIHVRVHAEALTEARELLAEVATRPQAVRPKLIGHPVLNALMVILYSVFGGPVPPTRSGSTFFLADPN